MIREVAEAEVAGWAVGTEVVIRERMRRVTFEVICRAVFGVEEPERVDRLREAMLAVMDTHSSLLRRVDAARDWAAGRPGGASTAGWRPPTRCSTRRSPGAGARPSSRIATTSSRCCCGRADEDGRPMSDAELRDELMTMLAAGHETTSTGLAFAFDLLLARPARPGAPARRARGGDDAYLDAVVTETLRLRPVIDATQRTLKAPRTVAGWDLPAGIRVYPGIAIVHRREDLYPNAAAFRPERFPEEDASSYTWLPFGGGIRRCIGAGARPGGDGRGPAGDPRARRPGAGQPAHRPGGPARDHARAQARGARCG